MRRALWVLALGGPWVAVLVLLWREQTLEEQMAKFVAASNEMLQSSVRAVQTQVGETMEAMVAERRID